MEKEMNRRLIAQYMEILTDIIKHGFINIGEPKEYLEWCQQIVAGLYTGYLHCIGEDEPMDSKKETLIAQTFNNVMLRGLLDLINTKPTKEGLEYFERLMKPLNDDFDDEFLPEVDDGR